MSFIIATLARSIITSGAIAAVPITAPTVVARWGGRASRGCLDGSNTCSLHLRHGFIHLRLTSFHFRNHALQFLGGVITGASSRGTSFASSFASLPTTFTSLTSSISFVPFTQFILLILGQKLELIKLVVAKGNASRSFARLLAVSTKATLGLAIGA